MKEKIKFTIYLVIFAVFMIVAMVGYKKLLNRKNIIDDYESNDIVDEERTKLPKFDVYINEKEKINIEFLTGKPIVINIWTSWCTYCVEEMKYFNEIYLKEKDNINFMMINATGDKDSIENANKFVNDNNYDFKPYYDLELEVLKSLNIYSYPTTIFVNSDGNIDYVKIGVITKEELEKRIEILK